MACCTGTGIELPAINSFTFGLFKVRRVVNSVKTELTIRIQAITVTDVGRSLISSGHRRETRRGAKAASELLLRSAQKVIAAVRWYSLVWASGRVRHSKVLLTASATSVGA